MTVDSAHLGKTAGKDQATEKATWPAVYGIEQSRRDAAQLIDEAFAALDPYGEPRRGPQIRRPLPGRAEELAAFRNCPLSRTMPSNAMEHSPQSIRATRPFASVTLMCAGFQLLQGQAYLLFLFEKFGGLFNVTWAGKNRQQCASSVTFLKRPTLSCFQQQPLVFALQSDGASGGCSAGRAAAYRPPSLLPW